jgi:hypothetical protein
LTQFGMKKDHNIWMCILQKDNCPLNF